MGAHTAVVVTSAVAGVLLLGLPASAQDAPPSPRVELGIAASVSAADTSGYDVRRAAGPRVTLNITPDVALDVAGDVSRVSGDGRLQPRDESSSVSVHLRRTMVQRGRASFHLVVGGGLQSHRTTWPAYEYTVGSYTFSVPEFVDEGTSGLADLGFGSRQHLTRHVTLCEDFLVRLADSSEDRASVSLDVPIGGRIILPRESARFGTSRIGTGDHVWVELSDRSQVEGRIERISTDRLDLVTASGRRTVAATEIDRIDVEDSVLDGLWRGTAIGAGGGLGLTVLATWVFCEGSCEPPETALVLVGGTMWGAGLGALIGALSDGLHVGERTIYRRGQQTSLTITPLVSARGAGVGSVLRW